MVFYTFFFVSISTQKKNFEFYLLGIILSSYGKVFHQAIHSLEDKYGDIFAFKILFHRIIIVSRIDYIEEILSKRKIYEISEITTRNFSLLFPDGLLSLKGDQWKRHARVMLPIFRRNQILPHFETMFNCIDDFIDQQFSNKNYKIHQNLAQECQNVLLRIIARIAFNYDFCNLSIIDSDNIHQSFNEMINCASQFALMTTIPLWFAKLILKFNWKFQQALKIMKYYVMIIINDE